MDTKDGILIVYMYPKFFYIVGIVDKVCFTDHK